MKKTFKTLSKRIVCSVLAFVFLLSLSACKSPAEKRLEELTEKAEEAEYAAYKAEREYEQMLKDFERYDELQAKIDSLPKGSAEYERAVEENNRLVRELLRKYPELKLE